MKPTGVLLALLALALAANALSFVPAAVLNGSSPAVPADGFGRPMGLAADGAGRLYVADAGKDRIIVYSENLTYLTVKGSVSGNGPTELSTPQGVWVDANGRVYIADTFNHRIQIYTDYSGQFLRTVPTGTGESNTLSRPGGVAVSSGGSIHVADTFNNRIQVFSQNGLFEASIRSTEHYGDTVFSHPESVYIDAPRRRIFVADTGNDRVQVFTDNYTFIARVGWGEGDLEFSSPGALAVDSAGRIYIADTGHNRVQVFSENYSFITSVTGNFSSPSGLAVDSRSRLFISDPVAAKVLVYQIADEGLERSITEQKISAARDAIASAGAAARAAASAIAAITATGCTNGSDAQAYVQSSVALAGSANGSLSSAEAAFARGDNAVAQSAADAARAFAVQASDAASRASANMAALNASGAGALAALGFAAASLAEADALNATARGANVTLRDAPELAVARALLASAKSLCSRGLFAEAREAGMLAAGNSSGAVSSLKQELNVAIIPAFSALRARLDRDEANVSSLGLPIDLSPVEMQFSVANTLLLDSRFDEALSALAVAQARLALAEAGIGEYSAQSAALRSSVSIGILSARERIAALSAFASSYSQAFDAVTAGASLALAEANFTAGNLTAANASLARAVAQLDASNASLSAIAARIEQAKDALAAAETELGAARAASLPLLSANLDAASSDIASARAALYTDPQQAAAYAEQAALKAHAEKERVDSQKPLYYTVAIVIAIVACLLILIVTGAAAGAYAVIRFLRVRARRLGEEAARLEKHLGKRR